uniref:4-coumarate--CoA ligase n=1 Tax=Leersia perrieri TaxID=77586 RepID=A0A0D9X4A8_9ORYZ
MRKSWGLNSGPGRPSPDRRWLLPFLTSLLISLTLLLASSTGLFSPPSLSPSSSSSILIDITTFESSNSGELNSSSIEFDNPDDAAVNSDAAGGDPPRIAYLLEGTKGDGIRMRRTLQAIYHPRNHYILHLDLEAPPRERIDLAMYVKGDAMFSQVGNVRVIAKGNLVTYKGPTMVACTLHAVAMLLKEGIEWDWFINLSASDYPLMTQDDILHVFSSLPRNLNFIEHMQISGWKIGRSSPSLIDAATASTLTRADLRRLVPTLAAALRSRHGIRKGSVVVLLLPNSLAFPVTLLAVLAAGGVVSPMNPSSSSAEIAARVSSTAASLVIASPDSARNIPPLAVPVVLVSDHHADHRAFEQLLDGDGGDGERIETIAAGVGQDDAAAILYSSGTTGRSKGAVLTHANLIAMVELFVRFEASQYAAASRTRGVRENVYLAALPMFHVYGLSLFAVGLISLGTTVVVMRRFDAGEAVRAIGRYGVTHLPLVPPIMAALVRAAAAGGVSPAEVASLVQVSCGAAPTRASLIRDFLQAFPHVDFIQVGYGMTESTAVGTRGFNTAKHKKYTSVGLLAPNMHAKIVHLESGSCLPPGSPGELWLHGPGIMKGYLNGDDDSCTRKDGWLRTGDIAYFDSDGYLYIVGRLKDTIKYKGFQIAPGDLEEVLIHHPEILDVAVTSADDEEAGEIPVAFVVRKSGSNLSCMQVMDYVAKQVAPYKKVRKVMFVEAIPKSAAGKVLRRLLKDTLDSAAASASSYISSKL